MKKIFYFICYFILFFVPKKKFKNIKKNLSRIIGTVDKVYCSHSCFVNIKISDISFDVFLKKNNTQAHRVYKDLQTEKKLYELQQITCLKNIYEIIEKPIFADLGSFVGYFAFFFTLLDKQKNTVYSVESNKEHADSIKKGIEKNRLSKINVLNKILSNKINDVLIAEELTIELEKFNSIKKNKNKDILLDDLSRIENEKKYYIDKSITLDKLFQSDFPNILKIDVHGAEGLVLDGADKLLKDHVKCIILELHADDYLKRYSPSFDKIKIITNLIEKDFNCYYISDNNTLDFKKSDYIKGISIYNNEIRLKYLKISLQNLRDIFFGREKEEQFIFCLKKEIDINKMKCF